MSGAYSRAQPTRSRAAPVRRLLLAGASLPAVLAGVLAAPVQAAGPAPFTPAWYGQRSAQTGTAVAGAAAPIGITPQQQKQIDTSKANVARAATALRTAREVQATAQAAARATGFVRPDGRTVTNGLGRTGLYFARGAAAGDSYDVTTAAARANDPSAKGLVWSGAELPTQTANSDVTAATTTTGTGDTATTTLNGKLKLTDAPGNTLVTVRQTQSKAILTWQNFDVGKDTTLYFNQTSADGTPQRDWTVLNRVLAGAPGADGSRVIAPPSLILGKIKGEGEVLVINQNGILFGGSAYVNTNSFSAVSLDVGLPFQTLAERNNYFLTNVSGRNNFSFQYLLETDAAKIADYGRLKLRLVNAPGDSVSSLIQVGRATETLITYLAKIEEDAREGDVVVEHGARIVTGPLDTKGEPVGLFAANNNISRLLLAGPNVINSGSLRADDGQVLLLGTRNFSLYANDGRSGKAIDASVRGVLVDIGQQDLTAIAQNPANGTANLNPFINRSLNETIFGNDPEGQVRQMPQGDPSLPPRIVGVAQGGSNYDLTRPAVINVDREITNLERRLDSRNRPYREARVFYNTADLATAYTGSVTNDGLVSTPRGAVTARASAITQNGVVHATTSVNQAGLIDLRGENVSSQTVRFFDNNGRPGLGQALQSNALGSVTSSAGAVTTILPDDQVQLDGTVKTLPSDATSLASFRRSEVRIGTDNTLLFTAAQRAANNTLRSNEGFIGNFGDTGGVAGVTDGAVTFAAGSLLAAPSGTVTIRASAPVEAISKNTYRPTGAPAEIIPAGGGGELILPAGIVAGVTVAGSSTAGGVTTPGAIIDVAGLADVVLPMESNVITVARVGQNELADSPLQRDGFIYRQRDIRVDRRLAGTREDGFAWRGTPLFDASGYIDARGQQVTELMTAGGTIDFGGATVVGTGALLNIAGGALTYAAGFVDTTVLLGADGRRTVDIGRANPLDRYSGFAGQFTEDHARWNASIAYDGLDLSNAGRNFEASYVEGGNAGRIVFSPTAQAFAPANFSTTIASTPVNFAASLFAFDGAINAGIVTGPYQRQGSAYYSAAKPAPRGGTLDLSNVIATTVTIASAADIAGRRAAAPEAFLPASPTPGAMLAAGIFTDQYWSAEALVESGLADIRLGFRGFQFNVSNVSAGLATATPTVNAGYATPVAATRVLTFGSDANPLAGGAAFGGAATGLALPDGGSVTLSAQAIAIDGSITAHGGTINLALLSPPLVDSEYLSMVNDLGLRQATTALLPRSSFSLGAGGVLDVSGRFFNDINATRDSLAGYDFVNGGTVRLTSSAIQTSVDFAPGSRVELSSGGYVTAAGRLGTTGNAGLGRGRGGNLSLQLSGLTRGAYVPLAPETDPAVTPGAAVPDAREQIDSALRLGGTINAFGFQGGGTFTLIAPEIEIADGTDGGTLGRIGLTPAFFTGHGFGAFNLTALLTARVDDGVQLTLSQQQLLPSGGVATATSLGEAATLGQYAANSVQRTPVNFSLTSLGFTDFFSRGGVEPDSDGRARAILVYASSTADNALTIGAGASLLGDPGAQIALAATGQIRIGDIAPGGNAPTRIVAHGGGITVRQRYGIVTTSSESSLTTDTDTSLVYGEGNSGANGITAAPSYTSAIIGSGVAIDASGVFLTDLRLTDRIGGTVLGGGTVVLNAVPIQDPLAPVLVLGRGDIVARTGSSIDVSGTAATIELAADSLSRAFDTVAVASAAGTIQLAGATLGSTLIANGGDASQAGGTLDIQTGAVVNASTVDFDGVAPGERPAQPTGAIRGALVTGQLAGSGIDALIVRGGLTFGENIDLRLNRSLTLISPALNFAGTATSTGTMADPQVSTVRLSAPYLRILSASGAVPATIAPSTALDRRASLILDGDNLVEVTNSVTIGGFATARIESDGDLRFAPGLATTVTGTGAAQVITTAYNYNAFLGTAGDLTIDAAQVYPATGVNATLFAGRANGLASSAENSGTLTILPGDNSASVPLSAGGALTFNAGTVVQQGVVRAPLGTLNFGVAGITQTVDLAPGSLSSVSADGVTIPYGETRNATSWTYANLSGSNLSAAPAKAVSIAAQSASLESGATIDLSGGGDIYATEYIPGLGGQRNVLTTSLSTDPSARIYAILPGQQPLVAPVDVNSAGNVLDLAPNIPGQTLTLLEDAGGLKAGTYTLYAGNYATLAGAYRVQVLPNSTDYRDDAGAALADGSVVVAGRLGVNGTPLASSRTAGFRVFSQDAWRQYSQIVSTSGAAFFSKQAADAGVAPAPLPVDAGRLAIAVTATDQALRAQADLKFGTATAGGIAGRGGQVDIAAKRIAVVSTALQPGLAAELDGVLVFTPGDIAAFKATSVLLGATRATSFTGDELDIVAQDIRIATTAADPLSNPELLFVTTGGIDSLANSIIVEAGSVVMASGAVTGALTQAIRFKPYTSFDPVTFVAFPVNDGNLLRLSNGAAAAVIRANRPAAPMGVIDIGGGATVDGGKALTIDAAANVRLDPSAVLKGEAVDLATRRLVFDTNAGTGDDTVIGTATLESLAKSKVLTLRAGDSIRFARPIAIGGAAARIDRLTLDTPVLIADTFGGGALGLDATTVVLSNGFALPRDAGGTPVAAVAGSGVLNATAETLVLTGGDRVVQGFDTFNFSGTKSVSLGDGGGTGTLTLPGALTITTPQVVLAGGSDQTLAASGTIDLLGTAAAIATDAIGGKLTLDAGTGVTIATGISARAGALSVRARSGDIALGSGAAIAAQGFAQAFKDKDVILAGGKVTLAADTGSVRAAVGSLIDVGAAARGNGGRIEITTGEATTGGGAAILGSAMLAGTLAGASGGDGTAGGAFVLDSRAAVDLEPLAARVMAGGFSGGFAVRAATGNLELTTTSITAREVQLIADDRSAGNGFVTVATTIDASGPDGGSIALLGQRGVTLTSAARLIARATAPAIGDKGGRGGTVEIGTAVLSPDNVVQTEGGRIVLAAGSSIDVSDARDANGVSTYGAGRGNGGAAVAIRAPIIGGGVDVTVGSTITGARTVVLEGYRRFTTANSAFDGIVDPAGWFNADGTYVTGLWTDPYGGIVEPGDVQKGIADARNVTDASYFSPVTYDIYTGAATDHSNRSHIDFYQKTLVDFAQDPGVDLSGFAGVTGLRFRPGIELVNADPAVNGGDIAVLSNWNLGAGAAADDLIYRTAAGEPGVLTLRAVGNIDVKASISDGFFRSTRYNAYSAFNFDDARLVSQLFTSDVGIIFGTTSPRFPVRFGQTIGDPPNFEASQYYRYYQYYAQRLIFDYSEFVLLWGDPSGQNTEAVPFAPLGYVSPATNYDAYTLAYRDYLANEVDKYNDKVTADNAANPRLRRQYRRAAAPTAPVDDSDYGNYAQNFRLFLAKLTEFNQDPVLSARALAGGPRPQGPTGVFGTANYAAFYAPVANRIDNNATAGDPLPVASSELNTAGNSWSYDLIAGANAASIDRLGLRAPAAAVTIGHPGSLTIGAPLTAATAQGSNTVIRTGTGSITIATAADVRWLNGNDSIYTAGIDNGANTGFVDRVNFNDFRQDDPATAEVEEFVVEFVLGHAEIPNVFAKRGGDITVTSRGSLIGAPPTEAVVNGFASPVASIDILDRFELNIIDETLGAPVGVSVSNPGKSFATAILERQGQSSATPALDGQFGGISLRERTSTNLPTIELPNLQSAEWVNTGKLSGSVLTLGGGNITLEASGEMSNLIVTSVSTFQASGGKRDVASGGIIPVSIDRYGGGDLSIFARGDISGVRLFAGRGRITVRTDGELRARTDAAQTFSETALAIDPTQLANSPRAATPYDVRQTYTAETVIGSENFVSIENGTIDIVARAGIAALGTNVDSALDRTVPDAARSLSNSFAIPLIINPFSQFGTDSATSIVAISGDVSFGSGGSEVVVPTGLPLNNTTPSLLVAAVRGNLDVAGNVGLAPSPAGSLDLLAYNALTFGAGKSSTAIAPPGIDFTNYTLISMDDRSQDQIDTPEHPQVGTGRTALDAFGLHSATAQPLHFADAAPSHLVALNGDLISGRGLDTAPVAGRVAGGITSFALAEPAVVFAGNDIVDLRFTSQNVRNDSLTSITAGRDITYSFVPGLDTNGRSISLPGGGTYTVGGPGRIELTAGRDLSLGASLDPRQAYLARRTVAANGVIGTTIGPVNVAGVSQGVLAVGNDLNPYLDRQSASIGILFGAGPTLGEPGNANIAGFVETYVNPANAAVLPQSYSADLKAFIDNRLTTAAREDNPTTGFVSDVTVDQAWTLFQTLSAEQQRTFAEQVFYSELRSITDPADRAQYQNFPRAYAAIDTLFPAAKGYTDNFKTADSSTAGTINDNPANPPFEVTQVPTGNLDMASALVRTSYGSGVNILGPGGNAVLGGLAIDARPQGIQTLRGGAINIFLDGSLAVNTSRIFTLLGGDETIFTASGDIDAGRGRRTASFLPPLVVSYLPTTTAVVDFGGLVSGAGIGTLRSLPGSPRADIFLLAPRGDIDAGDAGIRSSGNISIVANQVLNADTIISEGTTTGVPQVPTVNVAAVAAAANTSVAAGQGETAAAQRPLDQQSVVNVQVTGCSDEDVARGRCGPAKRP